jgi:hypothetical protein
MFTVSVRSVKRELIVYGCPLHERGTGYVTAMQPWKITDRPQRCHRIRIGRTDEHCVHAQHKDVGEDLCSALVRRGTSGELWYEPALESPAC